VRKTRQIKELQQQISSFNPDLISLREQIEHSEKKAEKRQRRLDKLRQEAANHTKEVEQLERSLREVSDAMEEFEREQAEESQAMGTTLEGDQLEEYNEKYVSRLLVPPLQHHRHLTELHTYVQEA